MHVLFLSKWYPNYKDPQLGTFVQQLAKALAAHCSVSVIHFIADPHIHSNYTVENISTSKKNDDGNHYNELLVHFKQKEPVTKVQRLLASKNILIGFNAAYRQICQNISKPDVVHAHVLSWVNILALYVKVRKGTPYIITCHWSGFLKGTYTYKWWHKLVFKQAACTTAVSEPLRKAIENNGLPITSIIPNAINASNFNTSSDALILKPNSLYFNWLSVSDLDDKNKQLSQVIRVVKQIHQTGRHIYYHIIGGGKDIDKLRQLIHNLQAEDYISLYGRQTHDVVIKQYAAIDAVVINSRFETFGMVAAEAIAAGKPVVATKCGGPESFVNKNNGRLIPVNNPIALQQAMEYIMDNYKQYNSKKMASSIKQQYGANNIAKLWLAIYKSIVI